MRGLGWYTVAGCISLAGCSEDIKPRKELAIPIAPVDISIVVSTQGKIETVICRDRTGKIRETAGNNTLTGRSDISLKQLYKDSQDKVVEIWEPVRASNGVRTIVLQYNWETRHILSIGATSQLDYRVNGRETKSYEFLDKCGQEAKKIGNTTNHKDLGYIG